MMRWLGYSVLAQDTKQSRTERRPSRWQFARHCRGILFCWQAKDTRRCKYRGMARSRLMMFKSRNRRCTRLDTMQKSLGPENYEADAVTHCWIGLRLRRV